MDYFKNQHISTRTSIVLSTISCILLLVVLHRLWKINYLIYQTESYTSTSGQKLRMTPNLPTGVGSWKNANSSQDCMNGDWDTWTTPGYQGSGSYYCEMPSGTGMYSGVWIDTDSNDICPQGAMMALSKSQCSSPVISGAVNGNNRLCCINNDPRCKNNFPADEQCTPISSCSTTADGINYNCANVQSTCNVAPSNLGLPSYIGYCSAGTNNSAYTPQTTSNTGTIQVFT